MKALLVDNGSSHVPLLEQMLREEGFDVRTVHFNEIEFPRDIAADFIVLSGGGALSIVSHPLEFAKEKELVSSAKSPVLGICLGFELIADLFGARLLHREESRKGIVDADVLENDPIFAGKKNFSVSVSHKFHLEKVPAELIALARSADGIQVIRHKDRPIYGFQFHPEHLEPENAGKELFSSLARLVVSQAFALK